MHKGHILSDLSTTFVSIHRILQYIIAHIICLLGQVFSVCSLREQQNCEYKIPPKKTFTEADVGQWQQVLINLPGSQCSLVLL